MLSAVVTIFDDEFGMSGTAGFSASSEFWPKSENERGCGVTDLRMMDDYCWWGKFIIARV